MLFNDVNMLRTQLSFTTVKYYRYLPVQYTRLASTCNWQHTELNICNLNMALHLKSFGNDFLSL